MGRQVVYRRFTGYKAVWWLILLVRVGIGLNIINNGIANISGG
jgi:hypothetical protein